MLAIPLLLAGVFGFALLELAHPRRLSNGSPPAAGSVWGVFFELLLRLSLGLGLGLSLQSTVAYFSLLMTDSLVPGLIVETILAVAGSVFLAVRGQKRAHVATWPDATELSQASQLSDDREAAQVGFWEKLTSPIWVDRLFTLSLVISVGVLATLPVLRWVQAPHGYWDAWQMWTPKALILYQAGGEWANRLSTFETHPSYPLLVPLTTARLWTWVGTPFHLGASFANSYAYAMSTLGVVVGATGLFGGKRAAAVAAAAIAAVPAFPAWTAAMYADLQVSFHVVALTALLAWSAATPRSAGLVALAGVAIGGMLWSKNEGMMLAIAAFPAVAVALVTPFDWRRGGITAVCLVLATAPFLFCLFHFKLVYAPAGEMAEALLSSKTAGTLLEAERWSIVLRHGARIVLQENIAIIAAVLSMIAFWRRPIWPGRSGLAIASLPLLAAFGYLYVYLRTPHSLSWHLGTSLSRILLHVFPSALLAFFFLGLAGSASKPGNNALPAAPPSPSSTTTRMALISFLPSVLAVLLLLPAISLTMRFDRLSEPPHWKRFSLTIANSRIETLRSLIGESETIAIGDVNNKHELPPVLLVAAQYHLSPRKIIVGGDAPWIIAFHKTSAESRRFAADQALTPVRDLKNGLRLYHRGPTGPDTARGAGRTIR